MNSRSVPVWIVLDPSNASSIVLTTWTYTQRVQLVSPRLLPGLSANSSVDYG